MFESAELLRHRALQARCRHPECEGTDFARDEIEQSIPARFEKMASRHPDHLSVKSPDSQLTYRQLDESANRLAHAILRLRGPGAEPVGVFLEHGAAAVVATLAVVKAGKFYVPLDPQYPSDRLMYMLDDTSASLIVTDERYRSSAVGLARGRVPVLTTDDRVADLPPDRAALRITPDAFASIYYSSGSTGRPKGVVYSHRYVLHNMRNYGSAFRVSTCDCWSWLHSYSFSSSSTDIFCPLLHGAALCSWNVQRDGLSGLGQWLADAGVTIINWMSTPFRSFAATLDRAQKLANVRLMVCGGEKLLTRDFIAFREFFSPECIYVIRWGATETGVARLFFFDKETPLHESVIPAGYAVPDKDVVVLDGNGAELAPGTIGEIGVRSHYFPPGYWRQPDMTREKYRHGANGDGARTYLTGDLGRMRSDGCLEHCGRKDSQVKIRGHRIETEEIEKVLCELPGVCEAVVRACERPSGDSFLTGYFVSDPGAMIDETAARRHLLGKLPAAMIPAAFVRLDALPYNANNKIEIAALPLPNLTPELPSDRYAPPRTPLQRHLVDLWETILEVRPIGIDDDFFELGGDSLHGMRMVNLLQPLLGSTLHVPPLFENPTIASYAEFLQSNYGEELRGQMPLDDSIEREDTVGLDPLKLGLVREEIAAFPIAARSLERQDGKNPSAVFVLAPGRSGTTLLRVILGGHPQLFAPPELHLLSHATMDQRRSVISESLQRGRLDGAIQALMTARDCPVDEAERMIRGYEDARLSIREFYRLLQSQVAGRRLVDKTPIYAMHPETLNRAEELFDQPLYIHLLRHPYAVILSYAEIHADQMALVRRPPGVSLTEFAEALWLIAHQNILEFLARIPQDRQMRLSFEDLVKMPRETVAALCRFLSVDLHPGMLNPYEERRQRMTDAIRPLTWATGDPKFHAHTDIDPDAADRWRRVYREDFLSSETWRVAELLGYPRALGCLSHSS
jgi:amino acid adenylation domain-containing protein